MSTTATSKDSPYNPIQFHGVRAISAVSCLVVISILVSFSIDLKNGGYKIPWTFLVVLITTFATFAVIILTSLINCCGRLSPILNLVFNIPLLILWIISLAVFSWNIYGALAHSCSITNWGNSDGVAVCNLYKGLYTCLIFGALSQIGMIVVDVRARIVHNRSGEYEKMDADVKLEPYRATPTATVSQTSVHDAAYVDPNQHEFQYRDDAGWRPGQRPNVNETLSRQQTQNHNQTQHLNQEQFVDRRTVNDQYGEDQFAQQHTQEHMHNDHYAENEFVQRHPQEHVMQEDQYARNQYTQHHPQAQEQILHSDQYAEHQYVQHHQQEHHMQSGHEYANHYGDVGTVRMDDFRNNNDVYQRPTYQSYHTGFDNDQYGGGNGHGQRY